MAELGIQPTIPCSQVSWATWAQHDKKVGPCKKSILYLLFWVGLVFEFLPDANFNLKRVTLKTLINKA